VKDGRAFRSLIFALMNYSDMCPVCGHRKLWILENWIGKIKAFENGSDKENTLKGLQLAPTFLTAQREFV